MSSIFSIEIHTLIRIQVRNWMNSKQLKSTAAHLRWKITWGSTCVSHVSVEGRGQCQVSFSITLQVLSWEWISHSSHRLATLAEQQSCSSTDSLIERRMSELRPSDLGSKHFNHWLSFPAKALEQDAITSG